MYPSHRHKPTPFVQRRCLQLLASRTVYTILRTLKALNTNVSEQYNCPTKTSHSTNPKSSKYAGYFSKQREDDNYQHQEFNALKYLNLYFVVPMRSCHFSDSFHIRTEKLSYSISKPRLLKNQRNIQIYYCVVRNKCSLCDPINHSFRCSC